MAALASDLRRQLENVCVQARELAEAAARSALQKRAVDAAEPFSHFTAAEKEMRIRLRARGRQVGDIRHANKTQDIDQLTQELAYEYWHRMLFARFLAENHLLMHPDGVAVSIEECNELAKSEGTPNGFVLAARYASRMLPQVFRTDDVLLEIELPINDRLPIEKLLASLPTSTFTADDGLGWVYQFWQTKRKDDVNKSGDKIDGRTLPAVTQLFTEDYMVQFLLHNTIGAWWCAEHGIKGPAGGAGVPAGKCPVELEYLRWRDDGTPAAGKFEGWPKTLKEFTMLDPCCGSGHFLAAGFNLLVPLRMHDESLSAQEACDAVLRDNLFGLELDPRCTQIAAFSLALAAWKYPDAGSYRPLPPLNVACSGQGVTGKKEEWLALANGDKRLRFSLDSLYDLFGLAPHLGSLINPKLVEGAAGITGTFPELQPLLSKALAKNVGDADLAAVGVAAQGIARAAELLAGRYTLVSTNVPYLKGERHGPTLHEFLAKHYPVSKGDLATAFVERCIGLSSMGGTVAIVTLQAWLFLTRRAALRRALLTTVSWETLARLGPRAFTAITGEVVNVVLLLMTNDLASDEQRLHEIDVAVGNDTTEKAQLLQSTKLVATRQAVYLATPDCRICVSDSSAELLGQYCISLHGQSTFDSSCFEFFFWELCKFGTDWVRQQLTTKFTQFFDGCSGVIRWENGTGLLARLMQAKKAGGYTSGAWRAGVSCWGKRGVLISQMDTLACSLYLGHSFDSNTAAIIPNDLEHLQAVWAYCSSPQFVDAVRILDKSLKVTNAALVKVPFDLSYWRSVAAEKYPNGLPEPHSDDSTQWLFKGDIATSTDPLQVAVARLLGYCWPEQSKESDAIDVLANKDGIVCIPAVRGEPPAADRLLEILQAGYAKKWSNAVLQTLLTDAGCKTGTSLDEWLRNWFFEQHSRRFHHRPFIWHIWDGHKEGFSCLVNYHKLNLKTLENLTYAYLHAWIKDQTHDAKAEKVGAGLKLAAAQALQEKLKLILAGEPPYDIFVRWKPLSEQVIGWNPDPNDGVRMNIRPFVEADILRKTPNIKWTKDRGNEPERDKDKYPWFWNGKEFVGNRVNDVHLTNVAKQAARKGAK